MYDRTTKVPANVNCYHGGRLCAGRRVIQDNLLGLLLCHCEERSDEAIPVGSQTRLPRPDKSGLAMTKRAWCWMKETATKGWRRDLLVPVPSLFLTPVAKSLPDFSYRSVCPAGEGNGYVHGADEQDDYSCPPSILHREGAGRSWAINNTSNVLGVE
jgi:hypothetical protein